jgi:hypothetical protein
LAALTQPEQGSSSCLPNEVEVFENVMGTRRGWTRGIGFKPSSHASVSHQQPQQPPAPPLTQVTLICLFYNLFDPTLVCLCIYGISLVNVSIIGIY